VLAASSVSNPFVPDVHGSLKAIINNFFNQRFPRQIYFAVFVGIKLDAAVPDDPVSMHLLSFPSYPSQLQVAQPFALNVKKEFDTVF
jgi:hypothetical protein